MPLLQKANMFMVAAFKKDQNMMSTLVKVYESMKGRRPDFSNIKDGHGNTILHYIFYNLDKPLYNILKEDEIELMIDQGNRCEYNPLQFMFALKGQEKGVQFIKKLRGKKVSDILRSIISNFDVEKITNPLPIPVTNEYYHEINDLSNHQNQTIEQLTREQYQNVINEKVNEQKD